MTKHPAPARVRAARLVSACLVVMAAGCAPNPVTLDVNFPSETSFLVSRFVRVDAIPVAPNALGVCPGFVEAAENNETVEGAIASVDNAQTCDMRRGIRLPDVGSGPRAYLVRVFDDSNTVLLVGCTVAEVYASAPAIRVEVYPTDDYDTAAMRLAPEPGETIDSRCGGGT